MQRPPSASLDSHSKSSKAETPAAPGSVSPGGQTPEESLRLRLQSSWFGMHQTHDQRGPQAGASAWLPWTHPRSFPHPQKRSRLSPASSAAPLPFFAPRSCSGQGQRAGEPGPKHTGQEAELAGSGGDCPTRHRGPPQQAEQPGLAGLPRGNHSGHGQLPGFRLLHRSFAKFKKEEQETGGSR